MTGNGRSNGSNGESSGEFWAPTHLTPKYEVSNLGRVRRAVAGHNTHAGKVLRQVLRQENGYLAVCLYPAPGKKVTWPVHRLVAFAFMPQEADTDLVVHHKNGDRLDNRLANLEWTTQRRNLLYAEDMIGDVFWGVGEDNIAAKLTETAVRAIRRELAAGRTQSAIASQFGVHRTTVGRIANGQLWTHV